MKTKRKPISHVTTGRSHQIHRREFLRRAGLATAALAGGQVLADAIFGELFARASAATSGTPSSVSANGFNYLHLSFPGAPPRWLFDLPLTALQPMTSSNFVQGAFGTVYGSKTGGGVQAEYALVPVKSGGQTFYLPPVWGMDVGTAGFASLLPNTLFVRGMDMQVNSHVLSNAMQVAPIFGGYSISGVVADASSLPIAAINSLGVNAASVFKTVKGFSPTYISTASANPAATLLAPFQNFLAGQSIGSPNATALQQQALQAFESYAAASGFSANSIPKVYDNAINLIDANVYSQSANWNAVFTKYQGLVDAALTLDTKATGVSDKAIAPIATDNRFNYYDSGGNSAPTTISDLRDMLNATGAKVNAPNMATNFAVAEMMTGNLTSSLTLGFTPLTNVMVGSSGTSVTLTHDQHFMGNLFGIQANTYFYRAFLGCLSEFVSHLKSANMFNETVIHISAEFNRSPRTDGSGADHGYMGSNATLISGQIDGTAVVGNVKKDPTALYPGNPGTWGVASEYDLDGFTRPIQQNDVVRQLSLMMGVADIVTNGMVLMAKGSSGWKPRKGAANV